MNADVLEASARFWALMNQMAVTPSTSQQQQQTELLLAALQGVANLENAAKQQTKAPKKSVNTSASGAPAPSATAKIFAKFDLIN